ncbi:MAG: hypothetical protein IJX28_06990 [Clostridia bacterium]|nr:hypothetical protein [Clostridia bacterium]
MYSMTAVLFSAGSESFWEKLSVWYRNSVIHELLTFLKERYFTVELGAYDNFTLGSDAAATLQTIFIALAFGIVIAAGMTAYTRSVLGGFVRKLVKSGANSPETALTLSELGYFRSSSIRSELWRGVTLRKVIRCVQEEEFLAGEQARKEAHLAAGKPASAFEPRRFRPDYTTARFYLPEELRYRAEVRFERKGSGWGLFLLSVVGAFVLAALLCWLLPDLLQLMDNFINLMSP